jgi:glycine cleavage system protein P-like pyridoxal-binding family
MGEKLQAVFKNLVQFSLWYRTLEFTSIVTLTLRAPTARETNNALENYNKRMNSDLGSHPRITVFVQKIGKHAVTFVDSIQKLKMERIYHRNEKISK